MKIKFTMPMFLMGPEGENTGGGASAPADQAAPANQPPNPAEAPVTRAEFEAFTAKLLDKIGTPAPAQAPSSPTTPQTEELPGWAKALGLDKLAPQIESLATTQAAQQMAAKKGQLLSTVLAGVPDSNRGTAAIIVEGMLALAGVDLAKNADLPALAVQLRNTLVEQHKSIFSTPGSQFSAIPAKGDGTYDLSGVNSLSELSAEGVRAISSPEEYRRLASGSSSNGSTSQASNGVISFRPRNKF